MNNKEEFEKWARSERLDVRTWSYGGYADSVTYGAFNGWQARQPEIDALKAKNEINLAANRGLGRLVDELQAENERLRKALPLTPEAVIAFIGNNFDSMEPVDEKGKPQGHLDCVRYSLTVHDLLSAFLDIDAAIKDTK